MAAPQFGTRRLLGPALARACEFGRDERGVTAIEFGILALPFFTIIFAIIQTAIVFLATQVLDSAVEDAARRVRTGEAASYTDTNFRDYMCGYTFGLFGDCSGLQIQSKILTTGFSGASNSIPQTCNTTTCTWTSGWAGYGSGSTTCRAVMQVTVYYRYPLLVVLPYFNLKNQPDNYRLISAMRVFRNEPYGSACGSS
jgi:hypothetical protein